MLAIITSGGICDRRRWFGESSHLAGILHWWILFWVEAFAHTGEMDCLLGPHPPWARLKHQSWSLCLLLLCCCYCLNTNSAGNNPVHTTGYIDGNEKIGYLIWPYFIWKHVAFHPFARYWLWFHTQLQRGAKAVSTSIHMAANWQIGVCLD